MNTPADEARINAIRFLAVDAVQKANSGHPGLPLGAAAAAYTLWTPPPALRSAGLALVRPRPLHPQRRARLGAALRAAPPGRLRPEHRGPAALPPARQRDAGPPGVPPHQGRRGHHRAARPGLRQRGRLRHRRGPPGGGLQPRPDDRRPPHLRHRRRRRLDGRHLGRGRLAGRAPGPGQADRALRRQQGLAGRSDRRRLHRGRARALRGLRLADDPGRPEPGQRRRGARRGDPGRQGRPAPRPA